jgi:membrane protein
MLSNAPKLKMLKQGIITFMDNDLTTSAAAVSYFFMLSLFPTLLLMLAIGNRLIGPERVKKYVIGQVLAFLPGAQSFVRKNLESISNISVSLIISCLIIMLWAASWIFTVIEKALNRIWGTYPRPFLRGRGVNFVVMSLILLLLGASALFTAFMSGLKAAVERLPLRFKPEIVELTSLAWQVAFIAASAVLTIILFTTLYKLLPNTKVPLREALAGAVLAGLLWEAAKFGFAYLLPFFHYDLLYGSIGAAVAMLSWVYLSSIIMLFGAQLTALLDRGAPTAKF